MQDMSFVQYDCTKLRSSLLTVSYICGLFLPLSFANCSSQQNFINAAISNVTTMKVLVDLFLQVH